MAKQDWQVIIVEDNFDDLQVVLTIFEYYGIEAYGVSTATEFITLLSQINPQLVLTDLAMPNSDGWDVLALVRQHDRQIAVAAMTSYHSNKLAAEVYQAGFDAYFPKPLDADQLIATLETIIRA